MIANKLKLKI